MMKLKKNSTIIILAFALSIIPHHFWDLKIWLDNKFWEKHKPNILQQYVFPLTGYLSYPVDGNGIPLYSTGGVYYSHPLIIASCGIAHYDKWLINKDRRHYYAFIKQANWLVANQQKKHYGDFDFSVWYYRFDKLSGGMKAPWVSALAQGRALSLLARAYEVTSDEKYLETAELALNSFKAPINYGGVRNIKNGLVFYEEYPPTRVVQNVLTSSGIVGQSQQTLNGFISSLYGPHDFWRLTKRTDAKQLFDEGVHTLKNALNQYDLGYYSAYDLTSFTPQNLKFRLNVAASIKSVAIFNAQQNSVSIRNFSKNGNYFIFTPGSKFVKIKVIFKNFETWKTPRLYFDYKSFDDPSWKLLKISQKTNNGYIEAVFSIPQSLYTRRITKAYHVMHILQLKTLAITTGDDYFKEVATKWSSYQIGIIRN